jgi:hypothetical protein
MVVRPTTFTYVMMVLWPRVKYKASRAELSKLQRLACLGITGAMKMAPTKTTGHSLGLPPFHLKIEADTQVVIYHLRCNEERNPRFTLYRKTSLPWDMMK